MNHLSVRITSASILAYFICIIGAHAQVTDYTPPRLDYDKFRIGLSGGVALPIASYALYADHGPVFVDGIYDSIDVVADERHRIAPFAQMQIGFGLNEEIDLGLLLNSVFPSDKGSGSTYSYNYDYWTLGTELLFTYYMQRSDESLRNRCESAWLVSMGATYISANTSFTEDLDPQQDVVDNHTTQVTTKAFTFAAGFRYQGGYRISDSIVLTGQLGLAFSAPVTPTYQYPYSADESGTRETTVTFNLPVTLSFVGGLGVSVLVR